jgi:hypothetical protein
LDFSIVRSFGESFISKTTTVTEEVRLRMAVVFVERKTRRLIETSSKLLAGAAGQRQLEVILAEADRCRMQVAANLNVSPSAVALGSESLRLLRSLSPTKVDSPTVVGPVVVLNR